MKTAFVTGASSGIGAAITVALAEAGYGVTAVARRAEALATLAASHAAITPLALDITDRAAVAQALAGRQIDVLVNNAGMMPRPGPFADADQAEIDRALDLNLGATVALTRLAVPAMRARGSGHVLFTGSASAHAVFADLAVYSATKAAISALAAGLRVELAPHGVRVTEIVPGRVETHLYDAVLDPAARDALYTSRVVQPEDVARMVCAVLALPEWACVTRFDIMPTRPPASGKEQAK